MKALRHAIQKSVHGACENGTLTAAQVKEVLKLAQVAVRQSKRVLSPEELQEAWDPSSWESLSQMLASSDKMKSSSGLQSMCSQVAKLSGQQTESAKPSKRKAASIAADAQEDTESPPKRKKRSKVNKS